MLSFITFASLLPRLSKFSLQERSEQTALIIPEAKWREKRNDNEFLLKMDTSKLNNQITRENL